MATELIENACPSLEANLKPAPNDVFADIWMCRIHQVKALLHLQLNDLVACKESLGRAEKLIQNLKSEMPANPSVDQMIAHNESRRAQLEESVTEATC